MRALHVVNADGTLRFDFTEMLKEETATFRGEQFVFDNMQTRFPEVDWSRHTFIVGEHHFPLDVLVAHVYVHARGGVCGYERHIRFD